MAELHGSPHDSALLQVAVSCFLFVIHNAVALRWFRRLLRAASSHTTWATHRTHSVALSGIRAVLVDLAILSYLTKNAAVLASPSNFCVVEWYVAIASAVHVSAQNALLVVLLVEVDSIVTAPPPATGLARHFKSKHRGKLIVLAIAQSAPLL